MTAHQKRMKEILALKAKHGKCFGKVHALPNLKSPPRNFLPGDAQRPAN